MNYNSVEILFAEDSIDDATLTLHALKKGGISNIIFHVKDGTEAIDFMYCQGSYKDRDINNKLKLILLDLKMPKISGIEVLEKIRSDSRFATIPLVILTSSNLDPDIERCYKLGANSYIVKPVESEIFFKTIENLGCYWLTLNQIPQ